MEYDAQQGMDYHLCHLNKIIDRISGVPFACICDLALTEM